MLLDLAWRLDQPILPGTKGLPAVAIGRKIRVVGGLHTFF